MAETNQERKIPLLAVINQTKPTKIPEIPEVRDRFRQLYQLLHGRTAEQAVAKYEAERYHFLNLLKDNAELQACTHLSLFGAFLDMAVNGLSFDPSLKHAYLVVQNHNIGTKDNKVWEKRAALWIAGPGELIMRMQQGQIKYADNPVLVYDCDIFRNGTRDGKPYLEHEATWPRPNEAEIIACYLRITRADDSVDYKILGIADVLRLKEASKQQGSLGWSAVGLPGMIESKTLKHAFKSYPKLKIGSFSKPAIEGIEPDLGDFKIDYGMEIDKPVDQPELTIDEPAPSLQNPAGITAPVVDRPAAAAPVVKSDIPPVTAENNGADLLRKKEGIRFENQGGDYDC